MKSITKIIERDKTIPLIDNRELDSCVIGYCRSTKRMIYSATCVIRVLAEKTSHDDALTLYQKKYETTEERVIWCFDHFD